MSSTQEVLVTGFRHDCSEFVFFLLCGCLCVCVFRTLSTLRAKLSPQTLIKPQIPQTLSPELLNPNPKP